MILKVRVKIESFFVCSFGFDFVLFFLLLFCFVFYCFVFVLFVFCCCCFFFNFCCCCCCCCLFFSFWKKVYFEKYHFANPLVEFLVGGISGEFLKQLVLRLLSSHSSLEYFIKLCSRCLRSKFFIMQRLHAMVIVS